MDTDATTTTKYGMIGTKNIHINANKHKISITELKK